MSTPDYTVTVRSITDSGRPEWTHNVYAKTRAAAHRKARRWVHRTVCDVDAEAMRIWIVGDNWSCLDLR